MSKNIIGERLKQARTKIKPKITQIDLLARLEVRGICLAESAISKIEAGTRPVTDKELLAIADALHVSTNWLLKLED